MYTGYPSIPVSISVASSGARSAMGQSIQGVLLVRRTVVLQLSGGSILLLRAGYRSMMWRVLETPHREVSVPLNLSFKSRQTRQPVHRQDFTIWEQVAGHTLLDIYWQRSSFYVYVKNLSTICFAGPFFSDNGRELCNYEDYSFNS